MATWDVVASLDAPSAGVFAFTGLSLSSYKVIEIHGYGITVTTDGTDIKLTFYVASSEVTGSSYQWASWSTQTSGGVTSDSSTGQAAILLCSDNANVDVGNASTAGSGFVCVVDAPGDTTLYKKLHFTQVSTVPSTGNSIIAPGCGLMTNAGAIDGIKISGTSSLTAGKVRILGLA